MTFALVAGKGPNEKLTSANWNTLDSDHTNAFDLRAGQTNSVLSLSTLSGAGRIILTSVNGTDADHTYQIDTGNLLVHVTTAVTANRIYTMSTTNAQTNDSICFFCDQAFSHEVQINSDAGSRLFTLGMQSTSDGQWVELIYNGVHWQLKKGGTPALRMQKFTANGTFTVPPSVTEVLLIGTGGGGAGGGGGRPDTAAPSKVGGGGGGGGAAQVVTYEATVTPASSVTVTIGTGGSGVGTGATGNNTSGTNGANGGDTSFGSFVFFGGESGRGGWADATVSGHCALGGSPSNASPVDYPNDVVITTTPTGSGILQYRQAGWGGNGGCGNPSFGAQPGISSGGKTGGLAGSNGTTSTGAGGLGGGGGGASFTSQGANGGAGGNGSAGAGTAGTAGSAGGGGGNGGCGGGGGGGGGNGVPSGNGGDGGRGQDGVLYVIWVK